MMHQFHAGERVMYRATNHEKIPATLLRECAARPGYWFCRIEGRIGLQCEHYCRFVPVERREPRLFVVVAGNGAQAERAAKKRGIAWTRTKRDCRIGKAQSGGYVPMSDIKKVMAWYCEETRFTGTPIDIRGACLFYTRAED